MFLYGRVRRFQRRQRKTGATPGKYFELGTTYSTFDFDFSDWTSGVEDTEIENFIFYVNPGSKTPWSGNITFEVLAQRGSGDPPDEASVLQKNANWWPANSGALVPFDPGTVGTVQFAQPSITVTEGQAPAVLQLTRTGGTDGAVRIYYRTVPGTAVAGSDFVAAGTSTSAFVDISGGATSQVINVPIRNDDNQFGQETVSFTVELLRACDGALLGSVASQSMVVSVVDDDVCPNKQVAVDGVCEEFNTWWYVTVHKTGIYDPFGFDFAAPRTLYPVSYVVVVAKASKDVELKMQVSEAMTLRSFPVVLDLVLDLDPPAFAMMSMPLVAAHPSPLAPCYVAPNTTLWEEHVPSGFSRNLLLVEDFPTKPSFQWQCRCVAYCTALCARAVQGT